MHRTKFMPYSVWGSVLVGLLLYGSTLAGKSSAQDKRPTVIVPMGSAITLQGSSVYTFFMTDNGATPIGVLRRDR